MTNHLVPIAYTCCPYCLQVLCVEDNILNQKLLEAMLKRLGHITTVAADGQIGINKATDPAAGIQLRFDYYEWCLD